MQQVLDLIALHDEARNALARPLEAFEWRLERATTNSPFEITALADPLDKTADVSGYVREVTREFSSGLNRLVGQGDPAWWMGPDFFEVATRVFRRNQNGIAVTTLQTDNSAPLRIDRQHADNAIRAIEAAAPLTIEGPGLSRSWGEIQGVIINAGYYYRAPALRLFSEQYGLVWCRVSKTVAESFGRQETLDDLWKGKTVGVEGDLVFAASGKLREIVTSSVREIAGAPRIDIDSIVDPNFTSGLDPVEYLRRLHEGELA
jgi:hypothetical protein